MADNAEFVLIHDVAVLRSAVEVLRAVTNEDEELLKSIAYINRKRFELQAEYDQKYRTNG